MKNPFNDPPRAKDPKATEQSKHASNVLSIAKKALLALSFVSKIGGDLKAETRDHTFTDKELPTSSRSTDMSADHRLTDSTTALLFKEGIGKEGDKGKEKGKIKTYDKSNTEQGSITPTGKSNSFNKNESGLSQGDLMEIAQQYGFRTDPLGFQSDILDYMQNNFPEDLKKMMEEFGPTDHAIKLGLSATDIDGYKDGLNGARTTFIIKSLKLKTENHGTSSSAHEATKVIVENPEKSIFNPEGYNRVIAGMDVSPSTEHLREKLIGIIQNMLDKNNDLSRDLDIEMFGFTSKIDTSMKASSLKEMIEMLKNMKIVNDDLELGVDVLLTKLNALQIDGKKTLASIYTDEELQGVTMEKLDSLQKLCEKKNTTAQIVMVMHESTYVLTIKDVKDAYKKKYTELYSGAYNPEAQIKRFISIIEDRMAQIAKTNDNHVRKDLENEISKLKKDIEGFKDNLRLNLSDFARIAKVKEDIAKK